MKKLLILGLLLMSTALLGQRIHTKEITLPNGDGTIIFNIITDDIKINFIENLYYDWYNEFSGNQSSKGAAGGKLLHGKYSMFDENGRLTFQCFYKYGLQDSISLSWDEHGEISTKAIFKNGVQTYTKSKFGDGRIWEAYYYMGKPNYIYRDYTEKNILLHESKCISTNPYIIEGVEYYPNLKTIKKHYFTCSLVDYYGEYKEYSNDGIVICVGNYDKKYKLGLKTGLWLVYNENSKRMDSIRYKLSETILNSAGDKEIGSLVYLPKSKEWIKYGEWHTLDNTGSVKDSKTYESNPFEKNNEIKITNPISEAPTNSIKFVKSENGLIEVPVVLNDVLRINFIFDSGASEVSLSPDVALTLIRTGTITENDFLPDQTYTFADGSSAKSKRFLIRKLMIGNQTLTNIEASISKSIEAPMLIGQNVMQKLGSITIDYENLLLIIRPR
jgi:aspartyl protease family protein